MINMLEKFLPSLRKKIAFALIVASILTSGAFMYFAHKTGYSMLEKDAQSKAHGVARIGKALFEYLMVHDRREQLEFAMKKIVVPDQVNDMLVLKTDGTISLHTTGSTKITKLPLDKFTPSNEYREERFFAQMENGSMYEYVVMPIIKNRDCYSCHTEPDSTMGYLAVKTSMDDVRRVALEHRTTNIIMTILILLGCGSVLFIMLMFLIIRPISKLQQQITRTESALESLEKGETVQFMELTIPERRDEIAGLMNAFNKLLRRLNEAHEKLHAMHLTQLEHADRLASTGEMAASMAHEIKNPIAGVLGALQVFDSEMPADNPRKEILAEMMLQLERINNAINDLLSYARPTPPQFEHASVNEIIQKSMTLLSQQFKGKNITIETLLPKEAIIIPADPKQLQQVFWNIFLNGIQAMDNGGILRVAVEEHNTTVVIGIADSGKGIPHGNLDRIFKPFFTTKHKGTGLGLSISRRIIEQHRGMITVESVVGKGTTVSLILPKY
jgi:signal transduction histidine kinase